KRLELTRMERRIARERQLLGSWGSSSSIDSPGAPPVAAASASRSTPRAIINDSAIRSALRRASIADRSERVLVESIVESLLTDNADVRRQAILRLGTRPQPVVPVLVLGVDDPDERVRLAALGALTGQKGA